MSFEVNGRTYESWDDVPEDLRRLVGGILPDADGDGVPDLVQGGGPTAGSHTYTSTSYTIDGTSYDSLDAVPPDLRETLRRMQGSFLRDGKGRPVVVGPDAARPPTDPSTPARDQVMLNGVPVDVDTATGQATKRHWWSRKDR